MKKYPLLLFLLVLFAIFLEVTDAKKKKKGLKIGGKKKKGLKINKKVKKLFIAKKHHKKKAAAAATTTTSSSTSVSIPQPTATTFSTTFTPSPILITVTDRNYNYFYGYPTNVAGIDYFRSPRFLVARPPEGGCGCGNKIIIVTRAPDERLI